MSGIAVQRCRLALWGFWYQTKAESPSLRRPLLGGLRLLLAQCPMHLFARSPLVRQGEPDGLQPDVPHTSYCRPKLLQQGETTTVATKIRLKRMGKIRSPHYRIVVMDSRKKRDGQAIEEIGLYHPKNDPSFIKVDSERAQYWLSVGAQPTEAVVAIFKRSGDWQKFTGDKTPAGIDPQPERRDREAEFAKALAEDSSYVLPSITKAGEKKTAQASTEQAPAEPAEAEEA